MLCATLGGWVLGVAAFVQRDRMTATLMFIAAFVLFFLVNFWIREFFRCPKCSVSVFYRKGFMVSPLPSMVCQNCGANLGTANPGDTSRSS